MCEKCEQREQEEEILKSQVEQKKKLGCSKCSDGLHCPVEQKLEQPEMININREVTNSETELKQIDEEMQKQHKELINGYDKQLEDCLHDMSTSVTKMLIMFEDYRKKGKTEEMVALLQSIGNYARMAQMASTVVITSSDMMIGKVRSNG